MTTDMSFSYTSFDLQIGHLLTLAGVMMEGWDSYSSTEMNIDLHSLVLKAQRLCALADQDKALQNDNLMIDRQTQNRLLYQQMDRFMAEVMSPFVKRVVERIKAGYGMSGHNGPAFGHHLSSILPLIASLLGDTGRIADITEQTKALEKKMQKTNKPVAFPGMTEMQRFWQLYELYTLMCYLLLHFQSLAKQPDVQLLPQDMGRLVMASLQQYTHSEAGRKELERYLEALRFDHGGQLTPSILADARIALRKEVPASLQLCFMQHINDIDALGQSLLEVEDKNASELEQFLVVVAKWQLLTSEMEALTAPDRKADDLPNVVLTDWLHDKPVSMKEMKKRIERMLTLVKQKNHWFCLWSVLRYHNYLKDTSAEAFAQQMCSPQWFGGRKDVLTFTGDTLREYNGYFTAQHFPLWNQTAYDLYRQSHHKTKWGSSLCASFQRKCYEMNEAFMTEA